MINSTPSNPPAPKLAHTECNCAAAPPRLALRPRNAAKALGIGTRKLWEITADQTSGIPHVRLGKCVMYPVDLLRDWLAEQAQKKGAGR